MSKMYRLRCRKCTDFNVENVPDLEAEVWGEGGHGAGPGADVG